MTKLSMSEEEMLKRKYTRPYEKRIEELEKENAELKKFLFCKGECIEQTEQLTKAKDLIEDMYDKIPASHSDYYKDVMERARQFIKEIEK